MYDELNVLKQENWELKKEQDNLIIEQENLKKINDELTENYNILKEKMCRIENSRSYKLYKKIKKICQ